MKFTNKIKTFILENNLAYTFSTWAPF